MSEEVIKKGEIYEGTVEYVDFPNKGVVSFLGERAHVKNVIPGQTVRFRLLKKHHGVGEGQLIEVVRPAPCETVPSCIHAGVCGGCIYQSLPYEEHLRLKETQIRKLIDAVTTDYEYLGIFASPKHEGYRNKMEFSFGDETKGGELALGLHKKGSFYDIVNITDCRITHPDYGKVLEVTQEFAKENALSFFHKMRHEGYLRHLVIRRAEKTEEMLISLVTSSQAPENEEKLLAEYKDALLKLPLEGKIAGILHIINDSAADAVQSDRTDVLYGKEWFTEELLGLSFKVSTFSFFQTNSLGAEVLYSKVRELIGEQKDKIVYDLYSGTGTIGQLMAPVSKKVYGIEIIEEAVAAANENAKQNGIDNCVFIAGDVLKELDNVKEKPDFIILDPPRDGVNPKALRKILAYNVDSLIYISCKPTSLARDLPEFLSSGYRLKKMLIVDMFPNTGNSECVALLSKGNE